MSNASNNQGRAFEYACLLELSRAIGIHRPTEIEKNSSFRAALNAWNSIDIDLQGTLVTSAKSMVETILNLEPLILDDGKDILTLKIQKDNEGVLGDVRDILIVRRNIKWEIGLSIKHNHFAVKHSRLGRNLDFGTRWFGIPCSDTYWTDVHDVFEYLTEEKEHGTNWRNLPDKEEGVYVPLLEAFIKEIMHTYEFTPDLPKKMVEYLLGHFDFYKVISIDSSRTTQIQTFNLRGTLNQPAQKCKPVIEIPVASLPTRIVHFGFKPNSNNTIELYMDGGWQFSFRIHNASTVVEPSLKFDVQIIGMPATIVSLNCSWK